LTRYQVEQLRPIDGSQSLKHITFEVSPIMIVINEQVFHELLKGKFEAYCLDYIDDETLETIRPAIRPIIEELKELLIDKPAD
jgi:hypothetical protein